MTVVRDRSWSLMGQDEVRAKMTLLISCREGWDVGRIWNNSKFLTVSPKLPRWGLWEEKGIVDERQFQITHISLRSNSYSLGRWLGGERACHASMMWSWSPLRQCKCWVEVCVKESQVHWSSA